METDPIQRQILLRALVDAQKVLGLEDTGVLEVCEAWQKEKEHRSEGTGKLAW